MRIALFILIFILFSPFSTYCETLTISEGLRLALKEENLIKIKEYEEKIAAQESKIARSPLLPKVEVSYGRSFLSHEPTAKNVLMGRPVEVPISERDFYTYSLSIRQLIFDFFGASSLYKHRKLGEEVKRIETEKVKNDVALQFLRYYFDLKEQEKTIVVLQKEVERLKAHLNDAKTLYQEGVITRNELLYTEVLLSDAHQRLINMKNLRKLTQSTLNKMMGKDLAQEITFEEPKRMPVLDQSLEEYIKEAESSRFELKIIQKAKDQLTYLKKAKKSEMLPRFFLEGKYTYTENRYQVYEGIRSLTLGVSLDLFEGGKTTSELKALDFEEKKILAEEKKAKDEIKLEVQKYYLDFLNAKERIRVTENAVRQAEENLRITEIKYKEGVGTGTEVLDAIAALSLSETNYYRALYDLMRAEAGLAHAVGKSLEKEYTK
jgi:outer membrane protein TolC